MKKKSFPFPMRTYERIIGIIYIPIHAYFLPLLLYVIAGAVGWRTNDATMSLIYYAFSALFLLLALNQYWKATIRDFTASPFKTLQAVILGYAIYFIGDFVLSLIMSYFLDSLVNPNSAAVVDTIGLNPNMMMTVTVLLAPIAEETMFRGALFGTLRKKNRLLAYVVMTLVFSLYHLWEYILGGSSPRILIYALQYVPASIALAWCYEFSGTLVAPTVLHALINLIVSINVVWR